MEWGSFGCGDWLFRGVESFNLDKEMEWGGFGGGDWLLRGVESFNLGRGRSFLLEREGFEIV